MCCGYRNRTYYFCYVKAAPSHLTYPQFFCTSKRIWTSILQFWKLKLYHLSYTRILEQIAGFEPAPEEWKSSMLPITPYLQLWNWPDSNGYLSGFNGACTPRTPQFQIVEALGLEPRTPVLKARCSSCWAIPQFLYSVRESNSYISVESRTH